VAATFEVGARAASGSQALASIDAACTVHRMPGNVAAAWQIAIRKMLEGNKDKGDYTVKKNPGIPRRLEKILRRNTSDQLVNDIVIDLINMRAFHQQNRSIARPGVVSMVEQDR